MAIHAVSAPTSSLRLAEAGGRRPAIYEHERAHAYRTHQLRELTRLHGIPDEDLHVVDGQLVDVVEAALEPLDVDFVVIGALSRTRVRRMFVGGTAEELLRCVTTDLLVVKQ